MADLGNLYLLKIKCLTEGPSSLWPLGLLRLKIVVRDLGWMERFWGECNAGWGWCCHGFVAVSFHPQP